MNWSYEGEVRRMERMKANFLRESWTAEVRQVEANKELHSF